MSLLSVVIPAYNEEQNISLAVAGISEVLETADIPYELIFVDDGSKDQTYARICEEARCHPAVRGVSFSRNFGKEAAIFAGLSEAKGDACVVTDCDLQFPPEVIPKMWKLWQQGFEVVEGKKSTRGNEKAAHGVCARLFYRLIGKAVGMDMQSSSDFKLLDRRVVNVMNTLQEKDTFFRALSFWAGFRTTTVEFEVAARTNGQSKWSIGGLFKYAVNNLTSFTTAPLRVVTVLGAASLIASFVMAIQTLIRFFMGSAVEGFTTVILLLLLIGGAIMISLGIIGHYIARIFDEVKNRPRYIVARRTEEE
ncbi:MAG: glycosyltransferase family 2 protein [Clostridia bacterium]|nr:glycosyltransferase family 2 protein [Clostridia bacterium]